MNYLYFFLCLRSEHFSEIDSLERLDLGFCQIYKIDYGVFGPNLRILDLSCNKLESFSMRWLQDPSKLEELSLSGNFITTIDSNFKSLTSLKSILLDHNNITFITPGTLGNGNTQFDVISLSFNTGLKELTPETFTGGPINIKNFDISNLQLTYLSADFFSKVNLTYLIQSNKKITVGNFR